jgi:hypothetical protein
MKTIYRTICAITGIIIASHFSAFAQNKATLAVLNIESKGVIPDAEAIGNMVRLEMEKTKIYEVIDAFDVRDILKKNNVDISNCLGKSCVIEAGKLLHADKMVLGSVERFGEKIAVILKVVDVQTGEIEKTNTMEYLNLQKEIQKMIEISVKKLAGIAPDLNTESVLVSYNQPIESPLTKVNLSGPRAGIYYTDGIAGERMRADKVPHGGLGMYTFSSLIGWQQEAQYLSSGNFQGLVEFIFTGSGLESGRFIPAITFLNGFRLNRQGWEIAFGPTLRVIKKADGYYQMHEDAKGNLSYDPVKDWHLVNEWNYSNGPNPFPIVSNIDDRGDPTLSAGLVIAVGKTFKSGYLNLPVNFYMIPRKEGSVYGLSFGFNIYKPSSN